MSGACEYNPNYKKEVSVKERENKKLEIVRLVGLSVVMIFVAWMEILQPLWIANTVVTVTVLIGGYPIYKESFFALRKGRVNMELSMVIAIGASLALLQYLPAIVITFFALLSEFVEGFIVEKGRKNIETLYKRSPKKAIVKKMENSNELEKSSIIKEIPVSEVNVGDIVIVREGDTIPIDGLIINGKSTIDQSTITGESMPIEKTERDSVFAGTINLTNRLEIKCEKISTDTTFAKIIHLVEEAESSKAPIQKLSDKMATRLIQFAIGLSVITFIVTNNIISTLSVIVVAGACGLAVGTPIALLASNSKLAKKGIVVKGGLQIENIKNAGAIVFDKTGTLTNGKPVVSQVISFDKQIEPKKVLEYAAIAERNVNHPLAKAIEERTAVENIEIKSLYNHNNIRESAYKSPNNSNAVKVGRGVSVIHNGHTISVGNIKFMEEELSSVNNNEGSHLNLKVILLSNTQNIRCLVNNHKGSQNDGIMKIATFNTKYSIDDYDSSNLLFNSTAAFVLLDGRIIGAILLDDKLRNETKEALSKIKFMGLRVIMLTGDSEKISKRIAMEAGVDEYFANLLPQDKVSKIKEIVGKQKMVKKTVIMVGDGINDAPALAQADVGIAMGTGTDVAIETADVVLMTEDLVKIPYLLKRSRQTLFTIQQNFFGTLFVDGLGFILAFMGMLNPLLAAFIHVISELIFMVNSARLLR